MSAALVRLVSVDGWHLAVENDSDDHPTIEDIELAAKLGFSRGRDIRKLIDRLRSEGLLCDSDVRATVARGPGFVGSKSYVAYRLTEAGALKVIAKSDTKVAHAILSQVIDVFIAYRRGVLTQPATTPVLATAARVGDNVLARDDVASRCRMAAGAIGVSLRRIHGAVRRQFLVAGIYHLPLAFLPLVREFLEALALRRLILPAAPKRLPPKKDDRQITMRWN